MNDKIESGSTEPLSFSDRHWAMEPDIPALAAARKLKKTDPMRAIKLYEELAEKGSLFALLHIGGMHFQGIGVKKNAIEAERYYTKADKIGSLYGSYSLALLYYRQRKFYKAKTLFDKCAQHGFAPAVGRLGRMYYYGHGVRRDIPKALALWKRSVGMGSVISNIYLALSYIQFKSGIDKFPIGIELLISSIVRFHEIRMRDPGSDLIK